MHHASGVHSCCQPLLSCYAFADSGHRIFLLDRKTVAPIGSETGPIEEFTVLGATANGGSAAVHPLSLAYFLLLDPVVGTHRHYLLSHLRKQVH